MTNTMRRVAPVLPARNVDAALALYRQLGFSGYRYGVGDNDSATYGYLRRDDVELHLAKVTELDPRRTTSACYHVVTAGMNDA